MKKVSKGKKGFTLVEMVLVIAIIVILAAVILLSVANIIDDSKTAHSDLQEHIDRSSSIIQVIESYM